MNNKKSYDYNYSRGDIGRFTTNRMQSNFDIVVVEKNQNKYKNREIIC
jgi:hypothetical protein